MKVNLTYPQFKKEKLQRSEIIRCAKWPCLSVAYFCLVVNICTGGKAWSVIVIWSLCILWTRGFAPDVVEYNRISQFIKLVTQSCILLVLIDLLITPGWAADVVPIVCFSSLIIVGVFFFSNLTRQIPNMFPMLILSVASLIASVLGLFILNSSKWQLVIMGALSLALLLACVGVLGRVMLHELKKLVHTQ